MKKIAIDCRSLQWERSGISRYLSNTLDKLFLFDKENIYYLLTPRPIKTNFKNKNVITVVLPGDFLRYKFLETPLFLKRNTIDIYWSPTQELPLVKIKNCRYVMTAHDIANELNKNLMRWNIRVMTEIGIYKRSMQLADTILSDSNSVKKDIVSWYKQNEKKIIVTYIGLDPIFDPIDKQKAQTYLKNRFDFSGDYIFYIDTVQSANLFTAFASLMKNEWRGKKITLVALGKFRDPKQNPEVLGKKLGISDYIYHIKEFISDKDINYLYAGSEFFVSPSFYEGFGLTPLEALRSGTSIAISDIPTHKEIFRDIPLYFNPLKADDIKNTMDQLYKNKKLKKQMLSQAEKLFVLYNWEKVGRRVLEILIK